MSGHDVLVVALALGAALAFATSNVLEQHAAREQPDDLSMRPALLVRLARSGRWLAGFGSDVGGFVLQAAALAVGALIVVAPVIALGVLFTLAIDALATGRRFRPVEVVAALTLSAALTLFLAISSPSGGVSRAPMRDWIPAAIVVVCVLGASYAIALRTNGVLRASLLGFAAGVCFGMSTALTKGFVDLMGHGVAAVFTHWEPYGLAVFSILGLLTVQSAFQGGALQASVPLVDITEPALGCILGAVLLREHLHAANDLEKASIAVSVVVMVSAAWVLARAEARRQERAQPEPVAAPAPVWPPVAEGVLSER